MLLILLVQIVPLEVFFKGVVADVEVSDQPLHMPVVPNVRMLPRLGHQTLKQLVRVFKR